MRVATAGIGLRAGHVLSILKQNMPEIEFVGYVDPQSSYLDMIGQHVPQFDTVEDMLAKTKPDLYFIGSPNSFHLDHIRAGLEANVQNIFTEKPVVTSISETMQLTKLLAKHGGGSRLMVGLVLRYSQHMVDLRNVIAENVLGDIVSLEANEHIGPYHGSFFMRDWRRARKYSGGFMLEKCCHDLDIYNMVTGSRPAKVASFGGRKSFVPAHAPISDAEAEVFHIKKSIWNSIDDPFQSDGDIIDFQTAILEFETGASMVFHTNLNVPDEHRRFCVMGAKGMAEGDFVRGFLKVTRRDGSTFLEKDYSQGGNAQLGAHYGADHMMVEDVVGFLRGQTHELPVSIVDALEAGVAALALDQARSSGQVVELASIWEEFDQYGLRT
ncbi:Gfo/Idh/MocA family protein [Pseudopelagicola sp. nBUS_19]|uniref:Gfo/Idh/MocA family protein n=1 Tax=Pseudopelagicola sp. nBUS_19 TaxID=3395316 RepID=UPI003EBA03BD